MDRRTEELLNTVIDEESLMCRELASYIRWNAEDEARLDSIYADAKFLAELDERARKYNPRADRVTVTSSMLTLIKLKAWQRTKAVYYFTPELMEDLSKTDDAVIYTDLFSRLPYQDLLLFFPENGFNDISYTGASLIGAYVHIEKAPETGTKRVGLHRLYYDFESNETEQGKGDLFDLENGKKISEIREHYAEEMTKMVGSIDIPLTTYTNKEVMASDLVRTIMGENTPITSIIVNCLYYLASKNADIKDIKNHKPKTKPKVKPASASAVKHEVGTEYARIVHRSMQTYNAEDTAPDDMETEAAAHRSGTKKRPHARRAHWHHYWTGEGRTNLEVRWISDLFVGVNRDQQAVVVYSASETKKEKTPEKKVSSGVRNPNTSRKKQKNSKKK